MAIFDPQKPFGTVHGSVQGCPRARFSQTGALFDNQKRCVREANGDAVAKNSDISSPGKATTVPAPPKTTALEDPIESELSIKLKKALGAAQEAQNQVPSTVNAEKVKALKAQIESQTTR